MRVPMPMPGAGAAHVLVGLAKQRNRRKLEIAKILQWNLSGIYWQAT